VGGPVIKGSHNVFIGGLPAATVGDTCTCVGPPDTIVKGSSTVFINGKPAARMGDSTSHGGVIIGGDFTVLIGDAGGGADGIADFELPAMMDKLAVSQVDQIAALSRAAGSGALGCEHC
jgi:uncharacterized Zn-binding protein involved in type VI secretion